ncbi:hypothetical protein WICPIJ_002149 [Wickerhamomyces pijperi]|uniref:Uncharacterized protein n=1 Tax=Wickerhamomyces pijperi TaxID=599730 RepID=A0A9P8TQ53_WICPI|nr:hypothetical protein WICPIJ_002149 [Wickerhamomyces pijperi]
MQKNIFDNFSLAGKVAVITGGARGIGYAVADCYCQAGASVALIDYNAEQVKQSSKALSAEYGCKVESYILDVAQPAKCDEAIAQIVQDFGTIDIFVGNAGIIWIDGAIISEEGLNNGIDKWRRIMDINLNANYYFARSVGQIFKEKKSGSFILTASMSGSIVNVPNYQAAYNVSKAGVKHMAKSLAVEWASFNARVNSISPGYIDSGLSDALDPAILAKWNSLIPFGRQGLPQELVGAYLYLASDASTYTSGSDIAIDGAYCSV